MDIWTFYNKKLTTPRESLKPHQRGLLAICDLRQEVNAGGFDSCFRYWGGDSALLAHAALPGVLGPEWERLLGDAIALFGVTYPESCDDRAEMIDELGLSARFEELDARLFELEGTGDVDAALSSQIRRARR